MGKINNPATGGGIPLPGPRGTKRFHDSGIPATVTGSLPGDEYLDLSNGNLYVKNDDGITWSLATNLRGPEGNPSTVPGPASMEPGPAGPRGNKRFTGAANPANVPGAIPGDEYLNTTTADLYSYNGSAWILAINLRGPQGAAGVGTGGTTEPRGLGGTQFRLTTRSAVSNRADVTPASAVELLDDILLALIDANNRAILPGQTADVTGSGLIADRTYYLDYPPAGVGPNMTAIPDPRPANWPTVNVSNVARRYKEVGRTWTYNDRLYLTLSTKPVTLSNEPAPITVRRLNLAALPYNSDLVASGHVATLVQHVGSDAAVPVLLADGDAGISASRALSTIQKDINGVMKGVSIRELPFGQTLNRYVVGWADQLGGEALLEWQCEGADFSTNVPGMFFCSTGSNTAGTPGIQYAIRWSNSGLRLVKAITDGRTLTSETQLFAATTAPTPAAFKKFHFRLRVVSSTKAVSLRVWESGIAEPATWQIDSFVIPELTAGKWGWRVKNNHHAIHQFALAPDGEAATYA